MYIRLRTILSLILAIAALAAWGATPAEILSKAASKLQSKKTLECTFTVSQGKHSLKGNLKSDGNKFAVNTQGSSSWYDGHDLWSYSDASGETTLVTPSPSELAETNPMLYLKYYARAFNASPGKKTAGKETVVLTPKKKGSAVASVTVTLNGTSLLPEKFTIASTDRKVTTIAVTGIKLGGSIPASSFVYPSARYKGVEVVDLR